MLDCFVHPSRPTKVLRWALQRRNEVLEEMVAHGKLSAAEREIEATPVAAHRKRHPIRATLSHCRS